MNRLLPIVAALAVVVGAREVEILQTEPVKESSHTRGKPDQDLVDSIADVLGVCPTYKSPAPPEHFRFTFEEYLTYGRRDTFWLSSVYFVDSPVYKFKVVRDGPASLEMSDMDYILSFKIRMENNQFNYTFKIETYQQSHTGSLSVKVDDSLGFYKMRIKRMSGDCRIKVESDELEKIGKRTATVTDIPFFEEHKTLKDQVTYWAGTNMVKNTIEWMFHKVVFDNFERCVKYDTGYRYKLCQLMSTLPEIPPSYARFDYLRY